MSLDGAPDPRARDGRGTTTSDDAATREGPGTTDATPGLLDAVRTVVQQELRAALTNSASRSVTDGDDPGATATAASPATEGDTGEERAQGCMSHTLAGH